MPAVIVARGKIGVWVQKDQYHPAALQAFEELGEAGYEFVTTDYVIAETVTRVRQQGGLKAAAQVWDLLEGGQTARVLEVERAHRKEARQVFMKFDQLVLSLVDCVSFVMMRQSGILHALTFDEDFQKAGFAVFPQR